MQEQSASGLGVAYAGMAAGTQDARPSFGIPPESCQGSTGQKFLLHQCMSGRQRDSALQLAPRRWTVATAEFRVSSRRYLYACRWAPKSVGLGHKFAVWAEHRLERTLGRNVSALISKSETLNINPAVGMTVGPYLSIGTGVSYQRLKATLTNAVTPLVPGGDARLDGSDWSWG